jgi:hypothetical protein
MYSEQAWFAGRHRKEGKREREKACLLCLLLASEIIYTMFFSAVQNGVASSHSDHLSYVCASGL